ncbi:hypothetical protein LINGRAHAP2_LOCUS21832 [Linum grandiflorum]
MDRSSVPPSAINSCSAPAAVSTSSNQEQIREIEELYNYLDKIKEMVLRPGCSPQMLKVALDSLSSLSKTLDFISANPQLLLASL